MNQNKKNNSNIVKILVFLLLVSFILYYADNIRLNIESYSAEKGSLEYKYKGTAIIIKDEDVYYSDFKGAAKNYYEEGERIKSGALISTIYPDFQSAGISREIDKINKAIDIRENEEDSDVNQELINQIESEIQSFILEKNYEKALEILEKYKENQGYSSEYTDMTLEELYDKRQDLSAYISSKKINIYSKTSGLVSYKIDNAEKIFNIRRIDSFTSGDYNIVNLEENITKKENLDVNDPILKVIDNFKWYIMINLENIKLENNEFINMRIIKNNEIIKGKIKKKQINETNTFLIIEGDKFFYDYFNERYLDVELILDKYNGIKIKNDSIIEKEGIPGVYVIGASKIVKFYPIKIIGQNEENSIIDEGSKYTLNSRGQIDLNGENFYTVKLYDKIISDPSEVKEGQILK
ncbi:MAG: HlyD family efflux transporter periplasmic adaptor subunit [Eubacteriales bacterium]